MKQLNDFFNLPEEQDDDHQDQPETDQPTALEIRQALTVSERIAAALKEVQGLDELDGEMNEIAKMALEKFETLSQYGMSVPEQHAGPILGEATKMLKIALQASDTKVKRKLEQVELMLKQRRLDIMDDAGGDEDDVPASGSGFKIDRNELFRIIKNGGQPND
jgi:hypothetical protein